MTSTMSPGRRILIRDMRTYVSQTGGVKFLALAVAVTALAVTWLLWVGGKPSAFFAGALTVLLPSVITYLVVVYGEFAPRLAGVAAEKEMHRLLRKHVGAEIWDVVPHVRFKNAADVDMVVVTPRAVLAMEVKWHGKFRPEDKIRSSAGQASYRARRLEDALRKLGLSPQVPVLPVLGVWGPASDLVSQGVRKFDGVTVVDAHQPDKWLPLLGTGHVSADTAASVVALLARHSASLSA